jgi:hypothetical protein
MQFAASVKVGSELTSDGFGQLTGASLKRT